MTTEETIQKNKKNILKYTVYHDMLTRLFLFTSLLFLLFSGNATNTIMIIPAAIAGGAALLGTGINAMAQGKMNKKTREWNEKMYAQQRTDALSDWQMQNAYNSPEQQMQRLKDAGLNPNLVYGNGAEAMSAQQPRQSQPGSWNPQIPDYSSAGQALGNSLMQYVDMKQKTAVTDNLKAQNVQLMEQIRSQKMDNAAKAMTYLQEAYAKNATNAGIAKTAVNKAVQELYNLQATGDVTDRQASLINEQSMHEASKHRLTDQEFSIRGTQHQIMKDENTRAWIMNSTNVREATARIASMMVSNAKSQVEMQSIRTLMEGQKSDNIMKDLDRLMYQKYGIKPGESWHQGIWKQGNSVIKEIVDFLQQKAGR